MSIDPFKEPEIAINFHFKDGAMRTVHSTESAFKAAWLTPGKAIILAHNAGVLMFNMDNLQSVNIHANGIYAAQELLQRMGG